MAALASMILALRSVSPSRLEGEEDRCTHDVRAAHTTCLATMGGGAALAPRDVLYVTET